MTFVGTPTTVIPSTPSTTPNTFLDLYSDLMQRVRVATNVNASVQQAKRYINIACQDIAMAGDYKMPWFERQAVLITHAPYTEGTVSVSVGGSTLTGSGTLWNTANNYGQNNLRNTGRLLLSGDQTNSYRVDTITDDTTCTIDRFIGSSALSGASYIYFEDEYALATDFLRPVDFQSFSDDQAIPLIARGEFRRRYPRNTVSGRPQIATLLDLGFQGGNQTPTRRIKFYPYPDAVYMIPYNYITSNIGITFEGTEVNELTEDDDMPIIPTRYRHLIVLHALKNWYRDKRDDARSQEVSSEYDVAVARMLADQEIGTHNRAQLRPRMGTYWDHATRPYHRRGGKHIDINGEFDRFLR